MNRSWELTPVAQLVVIATGLLVLALPPIAGALWLAALIGLWSAGIGREHDDHDIGWPR